MTKLTTLLSTLILATQHTLALPQSQPTPTPYTNLPSVPPGLFTSHARVEIHNTTLSSAWHALTNFPAYADWNPFVRFAAVVSPTNITLPRQYPQIDAYLIMRTQIPPLPLPVNKYTLDNPLAISPAYELITTVDEERRRLAWRYVPEQALDAERWQALSDLGGGTVLYEAREVFSGPLAETLRALMEEGLQKSFEAQGEGLRVLLEGGYSGE